MKIKVSEQTSVVKQVDVTFPVYSRHDCGDYHINTYFRRLEADGTQFTIIHYDSRFDVEISTRTFDHPIDNPDYILGHGEFKSSEAEFLQALKKAKPLLARLLEIV